MDILDEYGRSSLHCTALKDDFVEIQKLTEEGYNLNLADKKGSPPLHLAAQEFSLNSGGALLKKRSCG